MFPGFLEANTGCIPVVAPNPCAPMKSEGMGQFQESDFVPSFRPVTNWSYRVTLPQKIPWAMRQAFSLATSGKPGPVFVEIPMDVDNADVVTPAYNPVKQTLKSRADQKDVKQALDLLSKSEKPVILAGGGVVLSRAFSELLNFSESLAIPVLTTLSGRGTIPEDHPLAFGLTGLYRTRISKKSMKRPTC